MSVAYPLPLIRPAFLQRNAAAGPQADPLNSIQAARVAGSVAQDVPSVAAYQAGYVLAQRPLQHDREELCQTVWEQPMLKVAEQ